MRPSSLPLGAGGFFLSRVISFFIQISIFVGSDTAWIHTDLFKAVDCVMDLQMLSVYGRMTVYIVRLRLISYRMSHRLPNPSEKLCLQPQNGRG
jgi:hypothetical protein